MRSRTHRASLAANALRALTGNGLSVSEDLARSFVIIELDPGSENPEARPFEGDIRLEVKDRRAESLAGPGWQVGIGDLRPEKSRWSRNA